MADDDGWSCRRRFDDEFIVRRVNVNGIDIEYTDWGQDDEVNRPAMLVHGINVQSHTWDPIASVLSRRRRVLCPDLRGHGGSSWAPDGYRIASFMSDLILLAEALGLDSLDLVGHSLGARVTTAIAGTRPDLVGHMVLSDMGPEISRRGALRTTEMASARLQRRGFRDVEEATACYQEIHPEWRPVFHHLHARYQLRENWAGKLVERSDPDLYWLTRSAGRWDDEFLWDCCRRIEAPVLLAWGERSPYMDETIVQRMHEAIADFRDVRMSSGHYVPRELPGEFCELVENFFDT